MAVRLTYNGETHTVKEWSDITGINRRTLGTRIGLGWSAEEVLGVKKRTIKRGRKGKWNDKSTKLTADMITNTAALTFCEALLRLTRKDMREQMKKNKDTRMIESFFDTKLCGLMLECLGSECDGQEACERMKAEIRKGL